MTTTEVEVTRVSQDELRAAVEAMLEDAGVTMDELVAQGREGRFATEKLRRAWFVVSGFGLA